MELDALQKRELQEQLAGANVSVSKLKLHQTAQRFFEISPIHGCTYIGFHRAIYEAVFWAIVVCVCSGLCVNDVVLLVNKYKSQATAVSMVFQRNQSMNYADAAICFDVFRLNLQQSISANFSEKTFNHSLYLVNVAINTFTGGTDLSTLSLTNSSVDIVMKSLYMLIAAIVDYDLGTTAGGNGAALYDWNTLRAIQLVEVFFMQHGYTYGQLYEQVGRYMCKQMMYGDPTQPVYCPVRNVGGGVTCLDICATSTVTWVGYTMAFAPFDDICMSIPNVFLTSQDTIVLDPIYVTRISQLVIEWGRPATQVWGYGLPHMTFDMRGWRGLMDPRQMDSICLIADTTGFLVGVQIDTQFNAHNRSNGTCGSLPFSDCGLFSCLPAARMAADSCWPLAGYTLTSRRQPANVPTCNRQYTIDEILEIGNMSQYYGPWLTCIYDTCTFPPCTSEVYLYETSLSSTSTQGVNATLYQAKLSYAVLSEYVQMDFNAFLASLGGSMLLWLGCSLISFVHIPIFTVCAFVNKALLRRVNMVNKIRFGDKQEAALV